MTVLGMMLGVSVVAAMAVQGPQTPVVPQTQSQKPPVNPDAKALADFNERVKKYLELHNKVEAALPSLSDQSGPKRIRDRQVAFAKLIAAARASARSGDIFTPPVRQIFRRVIRNVLRGPSGREIRGDILDENTKPVPLRVNGPYPSDVPLSSVPPRMLEALPRLPEDLEYRFVERQLILFDNHAQIIVDYMTNALP
jgi:hypothetical protein